MEGMEEKPRSVEGENAVAGDGRAVQRSRSLEEKPSAPAMVTRQAHAVSVDSYTPPRIHASSTSTPTVQESPAEAENLDDLDDEELQERQRRLSQQAMAAALHLPSTAGEPSSTVCGKLAPLDETEEERQQREENCTVFKDLIEKANNKQTVSFAAFRHRPSSKKRKGYAETQLDRQINMELLQAYLVYARSVGHEPDIDISGERGKFLCDGDEEDLQEERPSFIQERQALDEHQHWWTKYLGTRYSKRRGCVQFWTWFFIGVIVLLIMSIWIATIHLDEVMHLGAFDEHDVIVTDDFTYLYLRDDVSFEIDYKVESTINENTDVNKTSFQVMLMGRSDFEDYKNGNDFEYVAKASTLRTTYADLPRTRIENDDPMYFVIQPCYIARNPTFDYCQTKKLPTPVSAHQKIYKLRHPTYPTSMNGINFTSIYVNPRPDKCSDSGWKGGGYVLLFVPYIVLMLFGLRILQMCFRCESFRDNLERKYKKEIEIPENEVDYWQPMPWDRKVPKTRLCGPCCWKKFRRPFEPFYTWWRHENYFTWIFFPYRNERLSRGERAIIIACSLYVTFYVLFIIVLVRDDAQDNISVFTGVILFYFLVMILPSAGKAIFKEIFKLIFRQRRKFYRLKAAGGDTESFSTGLAFSAQLLVAVCITLTQLPMIYIWLHRSCTFLRTFIYFGVLAAITRLSILGLVLDFAWYLILKTWGWKDLCPYCTERLVHCNCFNDEMLVMAVERVGPKWELIQMMDRLLSKHRNHPMQFDQYTPEQLRERWDIIVDRAHKHMGKMEKLEAYREKKRLDRIRNRSQRRSFVDAITFRRSFVEDDTIKDNKGERLDSDGDDVTERESSSSDEPPMCSLREKKILKVNEKIELDKFERHYDSSIVDVFHSMRRAISRRRRHLRRKKRQEAADREGSGDIEDDDNEERERQDTFGSSMSSGSGDGETMWVYDTPEERLQRREMEEYQRNRTFQVLKDYDIETVDPEPNAPGRFILFSPKSKKDSKKVPLLRQFSRQRTMPRDDEIVIVVKDDTPKEETSPARSHTVHEEADEYDGYESSTSAVSRSTVGAVIAPNSKTYAVMEKPRTLMRKMSSSANTFASWAFKYDT